MCLHSTKQFIAIGQLEIPVMLFTSLTLWSIIAVRATATKRPRCCSNPHIGQMAPLNTIVGTVAEQNLQTTLWSCYLRPQKTDRRTISGSKHLLLILLWSDIKFLYISVISVTLCLGISGLWRDVKFGW